MTFAEFRVAILHLYIYIYAMNIKNINLSDINKSSIDDEFCRVWRHWKEKCILRLAVLQICESIVRERGNTLKCFLDQKNPLSGCARVVGVCETD